MRANLLATAAFLGSSLVLGAGASAAPIYIGISENGGAISTIVNGANGSATVTNDYIDTDYIMNLSVEGTPPLAEPTLYSATIDISGQPAENETFSIYITELNQFPLDSGFWSTYTGGFAWTGGGQTPPNFNSIASFTASTYVTPENCTPAPACYSNFAFSTADLLTSQTFTQGGGTSYTDYAGSPLTTAPYAVTEVYTFSTGAGYGEFQASTLEQAPEPASLTLMGAGLAAIGFLRRRRRS